MKRSAVIKLVAGSVVLLLTFGLVVGLWSEIPHWRIGGTHSISTPSLTHSGRNGECPALETSIAMFGDSHVAGRNLGELDGRQGIPFGKALEEALGYRTTVSLYGVGGETAQLGEKRWSDSETGAGLVIIAYGTNDAAPRGWLRERIPVPIDDYKASLSRQIAMWQARDRQVIVMPPPPGGSAAIMERLSPYRHAAAEVGKKMGAAVLDPADAFASCSAQQPILTNDALHMNAAGHQCLGKWLAQQICPDAQ